MPTSTYNCLATVTLDSSSSSVTFTSIPQTYTDLVFVIWTKPYTSSEGAIKLNWNSDTSSNYSNTHLTGEDSGPTTGRNTSATSIAVTTGNSLNNPRQPLHIVEIFNYSNTTTYKTSLTRTASSTTSAAYVDSWVGLWRSNNAITSITVNVTYIFNIGAGSTFSLYGIKAE